MAPSWCDQGVKAYPLSFNVSGVIDLHVAIDPMRKAVHFFEVLSTNNLEDVKMGNKILTQVTFLTLRLG